MAGPNPGPVVDEVVVPFALVSLAFATAVVSAAIGVASASVVDAAPDVALSAVGAVAVAVGVAVAVAVGVAVCVAVGVAVAAVVVAVCGAVAVAFDVPFPERLKIPIVAGWGTPSAETVFASAFTVEPSSFDHESPLGLLQSASEDSSTPLASS